MDENAFGIREREFDRPKWADSCRIMLLGDSFTWGAGLDIDERYGNLVEKRLNESFPGRKIEVIYNTEVVACRGNGHLEGLTLAHRVTGERTEVSTGFMFVFIGASPCTAWLGSLVQLDRKGFVMTGPDLEAATHLKDWPLERAPYLLEASVPGVFSAGDVRHESVKRVASAVGLSCVATRQPEPSGM